jgi:osmotically-inducible protein OsmY
VQISYPAVARFSAPPVTATQLQADLSDLITRANGIISNPTGVQVLTRGNVVILRGEVKDEDEARILEGLVRLTPGVGGLQSELSYPKR